MPKPSSTHTRRAALSALAAAPAIVVLGAAGAAATAGVKAVPGPMSEEWKELIRWLSWLHPNGFDVGVAAFKAGYAAEDLTAIVPSGPMPRDQYPVLYFDAHNGGGQHTVSPGLHLRSLRWWG